MIYGSVCSGIEAASEAWAPLGWKPAFFSEIEPFPAWVLAQRHGASRPAFMPSPDEPGIEPDEIAERRVAIKAVASLPFVAPQTPNYGDMTTYKEWPDAALDVLVGGTPCQSFSVAGLRGGLDDERGNLMLTFVGIARRYRPRWVVWENVPGVLSNDGGTAFASLLGALTGRGVAAPPGGWQNAGIVPGIPGGYGVAWRVLDAQYFGVPQRRRRVFVVGYLGDWRGAAGVLFERSSLRGDPTPRREKGKRVADGIAGSLGVRGNRSHTELDGHGAYIPAPEVAGTLSDVGGHMRPGDTADTAPSYLLPILEAGARTGKSTTDLRAGSGIGDDGDPMFTLQSSKQHAVVIGVDESLNSSEEHIGPLTVRKGGGRGEALVFDTTQVTHPANHSNPQPGDPCHPLASTAQPPAIAFTQNQREEVRELEVAGALDSETGTHQRTYIAFGITDDETAVEEQLGTMGTPSSSGGGHPPAVAFESRFARNGRGAPSDVVPPLKAQSGQSGKGDAAPLVAVGFEPRYYTRDNKTGGAPSDVAVLKADAAKRGDSAPPVASSARLGMQVRRLTPRECERLQAFRDDYTLINYRGKPAADGPRYKALGNSMAVCVMHWLGKRIDAVEKILQEKKP